MADIVAILFGLWPVYIFLSDCYAKMKDDRRAKYVPLYYRGKPWT
jgi:hypothetical protein